MCKLSHGPIHERVQRLGADCLMGLGGLIMDQHQLPLSQAASPIHTQFGKRKQDVFVLVN